MKKMFALWIALFCVLFGTAYAEESHSVLVYGTELIVSDAQPMAYAKATLSGSATSVALSTVDDYNISLALSADGLTLTLNNVTLTGDAADGVCYDGEKAFTVNGVGTNSIVVTGDQKNGIVSNSKLTVGGSFSRISASGSAAKGIWSYGSSVTIDSSAKIDSIDGVSSCISSNGGQSLAGQIGSIGANLQPSYGLYAMKGSITISGSIDSIQATSRGINCGNGNVQIDGPVGTISVSGSIYPYTAYGLYLSAGKLTVNHSLGKITTTATRNSNIAILATRGIDVKQAALVEPEGGSTAYVSSLRSSCVVTSSGAISTTAKFVKTAPTPQPEPLPEQPEETIPQTGDGMNIALWASLLTVSLIGIAILSRKAKREY